MVETQRCVLDGGGDDAAGELARAARHARERARVWGTKGRVQGHGWGMEDVEDKEL